MKKKHTYLFIIASLFLAGLQQVAFGTTNKSDKPDKTLNILFIGNSFTFGPKLPEVFQSLSEEGQHNLNVAPFMVAYGGHKLFYHWHLRKTYNIVRLNSMTKPELEEQIKQFAPENFPKDAPDWFIDAEGKQYGPKRWSNLTRAKSMKYAKKNHEKWLKLIDKAPKWNYVVLQSWKDMQEKNSGSFFKYAAKFSEMANKEGAKVVLYITSPYSQNKVPVKKPIAAKRALKETRLARDFAKKIGALVVPMPLAIYFSQQERPDITFRYVNNFHLNHNSAYLAACLMYAAIFNTSPEGLKYNEVMGLGRKPDIDHDGNPRKQFISEDTRLYLQKLAWKTLQAFNKGTF